MGCTTDAHTAAEVFGGSLTVHFNPVIYGSGREALGGLVRALPDPHSRPLFRPFEVARRLPRMVREQRPALTAICEVAPLLAHELGLHASTPPLLAYLLERWDGKRPLKRAKGEQIQLLQNS